MGNYERTLRSIEYYETSIAELKEKLQSCITEDEVEIILETLIDYEQSLGECKGYLEELAEMDGYSSYESMMYDSYGWTY